MNNDLPQRRGGNLAAVPRNETFTLSPRADSCTADQGSFVFHESRRFISALTKVRL